MGPIAVQLQGPKINAIIVHESPIININYI